MNADEVLTAVFGDSDNSVMAVDHVFMVLGATYGAAWDRTLGAAPIADVKTAWAFHLGQFTHSPAAKRRIMWALKNLPDTVPNVMVFKSLCRQAPAAELPALPEPKADPTRVASELEKLSSLRQAVPQPAARLDWARRILARLEDGSKISRGAVTMARDALRGGV